MAVTSQHPLQVISDESCCLSATKMWNGEVPFSTLARLEVDSSETSCNHGRAVLLWQCCLFLVLRASFASRQEFHCKFRPNIQLAIQVNCSTHCHFEDLTDGKSKTHTTTLTNDCSIQMGKCLEDCFGLILSNPNSNVSILQSQFQCQWPQISTIAHRVDPSSRTAHEVQFCPGGWIWQCWKVNWEAFHAFDFSLDWTTSLWIAQIPICPLPHSCFARWFIEHHCHGRFGEAALQVHQSTDSLDVPIISNSIWKWQAKQPSKPGSDVCQHLHFATPSGWAADTQLLDDENPRKKKSMHLKKHKCWNLDTNDDTRSARKRWCFSIGTGQCGMAMEMASRAHGWGNASLPCSCPFRTSCGQIPNQSRPSPLPCHIGSFCKA